MMNLIRKLFNPPLRLSSLDMGENKRIVSKALKELNCIGEWREEKDAAIVRFGFQSGHFGIRIFSKHPQVELSFLFFAEAEMKDINIVRHVCNHFNLNSDGPRFSYTINEETNVIDLHILTALLLDEDRAQDILSSAMVDMFAWQNSFIRNLTDIKNDAKNSSTTDLEWASKEVERDIFLLREQELRHQKKGAEWRQNDKEAATLRQWMDKVFGYVDVVFSELTVITDAVMVINDRESIATYNLSDTLIANGSFVRQKAMLDLVFFLPAHPTTRRRMTFSIQQADGCDDVLYYQVVSTLLPLPSGTGRPLHTREVQVQSHSVLLAYDLRSTKQLQDEFVYMWKEAKSKLTNGEENQLTEEQRMIANVENMDAARFVYRSRTLYRQKRYYEAVAYLENAYQLLNSYLQKQSKTERSLFFEVCYMLGFCYNELRQYDRAYYYLTFVIGLNRALYAEEYVNCMIYLGDYRSLMTIDGILEDLHTSISDDEEGEVEQSLRPFLHFLYRRKAYVLIELRRLDEAEEILRQMIDDPESGDFALDELAYIQQLREKERISRADISKS
ncbi:tetratricopeptide repeat protein [Prevotella sp. F0091]|uniref:tetratricopeptide repeat protein n=2 Tax=Prevotella TaxID=838 RepID=UPI0003AD5977|nr:tetratricopeptide repeat protein [Prevotella sp. F0091]ERJ78993.1 tetratricopeptide repeat protein [Prevotella sp. F0091]